MTRLILTRRNRVPDKETDSISVGIRGIGQIQGNAYAAISQGLAHGERQGGPGLDFTLQGFRE